MCECPTEQCHCEVLTAYARECERAGQLIKGWCQETGCKNVTSYKYGASHQDAKSKNDVHYSTSTTVTTTTTSTTTTTTTELPDWIMSSSSLRKKGNSGSSSKIGPYLAGCSQQTAEFCNKRQLS